MQKLHLSIPKSLARFDYSPIFGSSRVSNYRGLLLTSLISAVLFSVAVRPIVAQPLAPSADIEETTLATARRQLNEQYAITVILPTYQRLNEHAAALQRASEEFQAVPTDVNFTALQAAWLAVSSTWAQSEAFAFGPVHSLGHGSALAFPADTSAIDKLLTTEPLVSAVSLDELEAVALHDSLGGLEAIAYLLEDKTASDFTAVERLYLQYIAAAAHTSTTALLAAWQEGWNGHAPYSQALATAGDVGNVFYQSSQAASEEIVRTLFNTLDVVTHEVLPEQIDSLVQGPDDAIDPVSLQLIASSIEGMQHAYTGGDTAGPDTASLSQLVAIADPAADQQIVADLEAAANQLRQTTSKSMDATAVTDALNAARLSLSSAQTQLEESAFPLFL